jgi:flavin reductase (DIM6/NTAB) family NADH-FMN oxidoreductase RutF
VNLLAGYLADAGVRDIKMYDVSATHPSYVLAEAFRYSHVVLASTTYNAGIFVNMENLLHDLAAHNWQGRTLAFIENGTWAPTSGKLMRDLVGGLKNMTVLDETLTLKSALAPGQEEQLKRMAMAIASGILPTSDQPVAETASTLDASAMFKLSYGLFLLSAKEKGKDNGCIINTVTQLTSNPQQVAIAVNKANLTHDMVKNSGLFNVSVLTERVPFEVFKQFGFQSGRDTDKFEGVHSVARSENGLLYLTEYTNAYLSCRVVSAIDCGTHTLFIAQVTAGAVLSSDPSVTYAYYFAHIKPSPKPAKEQEKKGYVCKICGYVYEGETLPDDFVCPLCKHGAEDFEKIE